MERNHSNILSSSLSQPIRYADFVEIIHSRVKKTAAKFIRSKNESWALRRKLDQKAGKPRYLTKKEETQSQQGFRIGQTLQLEIESFYLFSKIYLDKTAHFLEVYFGEIQNCSFESFSKFTSKLDLLESAHGFKVEHELREIIVKVEKEIVDFRNKKIAHAKMPRLDRGLTWNKKGTVLITSGFFYPKPTDKYFQTADVEDLLKLLEQYTNLWASFIALNRQKSKFQLKGNQSKGN